MRNTLEHTDLEIKQARRYVEVGEFREAIRILHPELLPVAMRPVPATPTIEDFMRRWSVLAV